MMPMPTFVGQSDIVRQLPSYVLVRFFVGNLPIRALTRDMPMEPWKLYDGRRVTTERGNELFLCFPNEGQVCPAGAPITDVTVIEYDASL